MKTKLHDEYKCSRFSADQYWGKEGHTKRKGSILLTIRQHMCKYNKEGHLLRKLIFYLENYCYSVFILKGFPVRTVLV